MIVVAGLTRRFGQTVAVDGVSLEIARGEVFGLLGPDGAGKTTLFRLLCAILEPSAGTARIAGADIRTAPERVKASIGYVPQSFALWRDLTVLENLRFIAETYELPRGAIAERRGEGCAGTMDTDSFSRHPARRGGIPWWPGAHGPCQPGRRACGLADPRSGATSAAVLADG